MRKITSLAVTGLALTSAALLRAQEASSAPAADEKTLVLSPFSITSEKDYGYRASASITATGIGTDIRNVPANIQVLTNDFLKDKNIGELRYAVNNVSSANSDNRDRNRGSIAIRGFEALIQQNGTDGTYLELDNVDRIEIIKGPSAVFHGIVRPGGVINVIKAAPEFTPSGYIQGRYGSYDFKKIEARATGPLIADKLAYNVFASYRDQDRRPDYTFDEVKFFSAGLKWTPVPRFSTLLDFERKDETYEFIHSLPITHPAYLAAVDAGTVPYRQTARAWLDANPAYGPNTSLGQMFVTDRMFPYEDFNPMGPHSPSTQKGYNVRSESTFTLSEALNFRLLATRASVDDVILEHNTFRPVAGKTPGELIFDSRFQELSQGNEMFVIKAEAAAKVSFTGMDHQFIGGVSDQTNRNYARTLNGPLIPWNPLTEPIRDGLAEMASAFPSGRPALPAKAKSKTRGYYLTDQISALHGDLRLILGARHTEAENASGLEQAETTPQAGVLYRAMRAASVYANYSKTFEPNYILDGAGKQVGPTTGKGMEAGIKFETPDESLSGSVAVYQVERGNIPRRDFPTEAATGIVPSYVLGGLERTRGFEADFIYSPVRNYQLIGSFTYSWEHETVESTGDVRQVGVDLSNTPTVVFNLWNKYTFTNGPLKGLAIGAGAKVSSSFKLHPSWDVALRGDGYVTFDGLISYEKKRSWGLVDLQLNLENITSQRYYQGVYLLSDPITAYVSVRFSFR
ncbi:MAG TPA: TonB-dependent receptor [Opitutaceae bacterium]|nr:TonB-dependent receptor [Opitutaceae bacterium]